MNGGAQENELLHEILKCTKSTTDGQRRQRALHGLKNEKGSKYSHPVRGHQLRHRHLQFIGIMPSLWDLVVRSTIPRQVC
jgi:hypothetical protein